MLKPDPSNVGVSPFTGTWVFDPAASTLQQLTVLAWTSHLTVDAGRLRSHEEIHWPSGPAALDVDAGLDGNYYPVSGSPLNDEIAYVLENGSIHGTGRKNGVVSFREVLRVPEPDHLVLTLTLVNDGKEVPLGAAHFRRD